MTYSVLTFTEASGSGFSFSVRAKTHLTPDGCLWIVPEDDSFTVGDVQFGPTPASLDGVLDGTELQTVRLPTLTLHEEV